MIAHPGTNFARSRIRRNRYRIFWISIQFRNGIRYRTVPALTGEGEHRGAPPPPPVPGRKASLSK